MPVDSLFDLSGRIALVTGSARGLGLAIARGLSGAGATVILNGRDSSALEASARAIADAGGNVGIAAFDVTDRSAVRDGIAKIEAAHGAIDVLVNNAGIQRRGPMVDYRVEDWDTIIATNLSAPFFVSQAVLPAMIARGRGKIIHVASLTSELARPNIVPYSAAKGGVRQLTRGMAVELARHNIQVNAIAPGYFATEMNRALTDDRDFDQWLKRRTPAGRWGRPDELAGLAVYLASSASDFMTGQILYIDGGFTAAM